MNKISRRRFVQHLATSTVALAAANPFAIQSADTPAAKWRICAFEKPLQFLKYDELADLMAELGYQGIEATVRPGGHIEPERVEEELPRFTDALKKRGLEITILTSGINSVKQPHAEKVLKTAAKLGIQRYRMLWWRYDLSKPIRPQLEALRPILKDLVALNRSVGISGLYQNHSGADMVGASLWDIYDLLKDYAPQELSLAYDIRHAQVEGGLSWPTQFHLVKSRIGVVCVKDFRWKGADVENVPLGTGRVDAKVIRRIKEAGFPGPFSVHVEYGETGGKDSLKAAFRQDLATLGKWLQAA